MFDPWRLVAKLVGWTISWQPLATRGLTRWGDRAILLDTGLTAVEERVVLTHELVHASRGPFPGWVAAREEAAVWRDTGLLLVDIAHLEEAAAWSRHVLVIAEQLDVDETTVLARATALTPHERARIDARIELIHLP